MFDDIMSMYQDFGSLCNSIFTTNKNIQSVAIINKMGRTIEKLAKPKFAKQYEGTMNEPFFMQSVLQISMGRDFDDTFGPINYHISNRTTLTMLTFPLLDHVILVTLNKNIGPISVAQKIVNIVTDYTKRPESSLLVAQYEKNSSP